MDFQERFPTVTGRPSVFICHAYPDQSGIRKRTAIFATFRRITAFSEICGPQFYSMSSIGRFPPDSSENACHLFAQRCSPVSVFPLSWATVLNGLPHILFCDTTTRRQFVCRIVIL